MGRYVIVLRSDNKDDLFLQPNVMRERKPNGKWTYWAETGYFDDIIAADETARRYRTKTVRARVELAMISGC